MWRCISDKGADFLCSVQAIASLSGARSLSAVPAAKGVGRGLMTREEMEGGNAALGDAGRAWS